MSKLFQTRLLVKSPVGLLGLVLVLFIVSIAFLAPVLALHDPVEPNLRVRLLPPAWEASRGDARYWLGTDQLGRDVLSRLMFGSRTSLVVGVLSVCISMVTGVALGLISGYYGGSIDYIVSRSADMFMSVPFIVLAISVMGVLGAQGGGETVLILVIGLANWVTFNRVVRGEVLTVKTMEYVDAARCQGQSAPRIIMRHILPNVTASIIVLATLQVSSAILAESSLSFLGLGVQPPSVTWGTMLSEGRDHLATSWWLSTFPGLAIALTTLGIVLLGDWLRDVLDPALQH